MAHLLEAPDAFAQWEHVPSRLVYQGTDHRAPKLTIAIPTFRRVALLAEAVRSALAQDWNEPFEVIVVDNDSESTGAEALAALVPELATANFRYYVNAENTGMFGNWNRSIELARAPWYTMLHDDDLLEADFASRMMSILEQDPKIDGIICRRVVFGPTIVPRKGRILNLARRLGTEVRFGGKGVRRFKPARFFWSATNPVGLIARRADLIALGGYQPGEWPSSDYFFQLRFALAHQLFEARYYLVRIRMLENESIKPETYLHMAIDSHFLRAKMAGSVVPRWWMAMSGLVLAAQRKILCDSNFPVTREALQEATGAKIPRRAHPALLVGAKALLKGF